MTTKSLHVPAPMIARPKPKDIKIQAPTLEIAIERAIEEVRDYPYRSDYDESVGIPNTIRLKTVEIYGIASRDTTTTYIFEVV